MYLNFNFEPFGMGESSKIRFSKKLGVNIKKKPRYFKVSTINKFLRLTNIQTSNNSVELKTRDNISFSKRIKSYKGIRHRNNYPVRGQRTHTNATKKNSKKKGVA